MHGRFWGVVGSSVSALVRQPMACSTLPPDFLEDPANFFKWEIKLTDTMETFLVSRRSRRNLFQEEFEMCRLFIIFFLNYNFWRK